MLGLLLISTRGVLSFQASGDVWLGEWILGTVGGGG